MLKTPILRYLSLLIVEKALYVIDQILAITLITDGSFMIIHMLWYNWACSAMQIVIIT